MQTGAGGLAQLLEAGLLLWRSFRRLAVSFRALAVYVISSGAPERTCSTNRGTGVESNCDGSDHHADLPRFFIGDYLPSDIPDHALHAPTVTQA
jgi:hypothetical protein